jgi:imidazolonepropionase-like amidohydrolase
VREVEEIAGQQVAVAIEAGVKIAVGSDLVTQGANLRELLLLSRAGMPVNDVLLAATIGGAELLGLQSTHGRIRPGFVFDAVVLDHDPSDIEIFGSAAPVTGVFQAGRTVRPHESWQQGLRYTTEEK